MKPDAITHEIIASLIGEPERWRLVRAAIRYGVHVERFERADGLSFILARHVPMIPFVGARVQVSYGRAADMLTGRAAKAVLKATNIWCDNEKARSKTALSERLAARR